MQLEQRRLGDLNPNDLKVDDSGMEEITVNTAPPTSVTVWLLLAGLVVVTQLT